MKHFKEEFKAKREMNDLEHEIESQYLSLQSKKAELSVVVKDKGPSNIQVKIINEEIEEVNQRLLGLKNKLKEGEARHGELEQNRERFRRAWQNDPSVTEIHMEVLSLIMKESIQVVEKMSTETRF
jgi:hypothetical protein